MGGKDKTTGTSPEEFTNARNVETLFKEFMTRREAGATITPDEYIKKHPGFEKQLGKLFNGLRETPLFTTNFYESHHSPQPPL